MKKRNRHLRQMGVNGVVLGILDAGKLESTCRVRASWYNGLVRSRLHSIARSMNQRTCRRALEAVIQTGADRILTSGGARNAEDGSPMLSELVKKAAGRIGILASGTIRETNVRKIVEETGVHEVHASLLRRSIEGQPLSQSALQPETVARFLEAARS